MDRTKQLKEAKEMILEIKGDLLFTLGLEWRMDETLGEAKAELTRAAKKLTIIINQLEKK